jgi:glutamyl/glutaminyl-tRNA synthetase
MGEGEEAIDDHLLGSWSGPAAADGDLLVRDRHGQWTYHLCVVVDDARHGIDLVIRGQDLLEATPRQLRLGRLLGLPRPAYLHHPLVRSSNGTKLSKSDGATGVRDLRAAGRSAAWVLGAAAAGIGLGEPAPMDREAVSRLFGGPPG